MQPNFESIRKRVEQWQRTELTDVTAKVVSTRQSWRASSKLPSIVLARSTICTSNQSMRNSARERSGVCRTRSPPRSRNRSQVRSSKRRRSWKSSRNLGSRKLPDKHGGAGRADLLFLLADRPPAVTHVIKNHRFCAKSNSSVELPNAMVRTIRNATQSADLRWQLGVQEWTLPERRPRQEPSQRWRQLWGRSS